MSRYEGIRTKHARSCRSRDGGRCNCSPSYEARLRVGGASGRLLGKTFRSEAAARAWRSDTANAARAGEILVGEAGTLDDAAERLIRGMQSGAIRNRSGDEYKPSVTRSYAEVLGKHIRPRLGKRRLDRIQRRDVQAIVDEMLAGGAQPSTVRNAVMPLRVIYKRAVKDGVVRHSPAELLDMPAVRGRRDRIAPAKEAAALVAALPEGSLERALWATALYAGLRRGELRALVWADVDLQRGTISVERSLDARGAVIEPKTRSGRRLVPIVEPLRAELRRWHLKTLREPLVFPGARGPFTPTTVARLAKEAWAAHDPPLAPIGLHEARHTAASFFIAAGLNAKTVMTLIGHSSITETYNRYGHLFPGAEEEAGRMVDAYLEKELA